MNNGPVICLLARYSQIAWVIARICASFKLALSELPRWPLVPKANQLRRVVDIGLTLVIGLLQRRHVDQDIGRRRLAGKWMNRHLLPTPF